MLTFEPPFEDIFILHVFRHGGQVACKFILRVVLNRSERWQVVEYILC